jgi:hypothetical protein
MPWSALERPTKVHYLGSCILYRVEATKVVAKHLALLRTLLPPLLAKIILHFLSLKPRSYVQIGGSEGESISIIDRELEYQSENFIVHSCDL